MKRIFSITVVLLLLIASAFANIPGGGTGAGASVTLTDSGTTVTMANGIVSILCNKSGGNITQINYTYNNGGGAQTLNLLSGGNNGGQLYWENSSSQGLAFSYSLVVDPASNGGNYAEISLVTTSVTNDVLEVHFSMSRGSTGFYVTAIYGHRSIDGAFGMGECRDNIYAGSIFNWMCVDSARNRLMEVSGGSAIGVQGAPVEVSLWTNGIYAGQYEDKYKYSADLGVQRAWGWCSVGAGGKNVGLWNISASSEYYNGGPLKRELMSHIGTTILNMINGGHYGMGSDGNFVSSEVWTKVCGPYFIYCNNVTNTLTVTNQAAQALYADALAQAAAEQTAWPYSWFTNTSYAPASQRGTIMGQFVINDSGNPNASAGGLWVGAIQQPATSTGTYDFQQWMKPYQFWVRADAGGNFRMPGVIAGGNYTLYAFGPGAAGTFLSQTQAGGGPPLLVDYPAAQFAVSVVGGATNDLGAVTWAPARVGPTVFEIGYPDRTAAKFRHGDDYWVGDLGPGASAPSPVWSKWLEYPFDFPNGVDYVVGQSRWSTDWNFIQPVTTDSQGSYNGSSSTITFNLASAPANGAQASLYLGLASDYYSAVIVTVNGSNLGSVGGVAGTPNGSIPATGYYPGYSASDSNIREGNNAAFSDERITFPATQLHAGANTINIGIRQIGGSYFADHLMYDYVRLELTGYVPPAPGSVVAYAGNNGALVCWPVTPGATSYNVLRSTGAGGGYASITNGVVGPVCGSGSNNAVYLDLTAANGATYYYAVRSVNPAGSSTNSSPSPGVTPSAAVAAGAPAAPAGLAVGSSGHQSVTLGWNASAGANFYSVWRSVLVSTGGGSSNALNTIILNNSATNTSYTDTTPTDGSIYSYFVTATGAGGTSGGSAPAVVRPLPAAPASLPGSLTGLFSATNVITLNWTAVSGAVGYAVYRATSSGGPFTFLQSITETVYNDSPVSSNTVYYYRVAAVNGGGVSANATDSVNGQQVFPAGLTALGGNAQVTLAWPATAGATSYNLKRGTGSGNETTTVATGITGLSYTNTGLANGTTYYYVVTATGGGETSGSSPEASATPFANNSGIWVSPASGNWGTAANWSGGGIASGSGSTADFSTLALSSNLTVTLDSARTVSGLKFGDMGSTYNWTLAGTNALTLGLNPGVNVANQAATLNTVIAGVAGLAKTGLGTLILGGATDTVTGGTTASAGSLVLDFAAANSPAANMVPAANALALGGGTLQINGGSQTFASATLNAGASVIAATGANIPAVNLNTLTASAGGLVEFVGPATIGAGGASVAANASITTAAGGNGAFVGGNGAAFFAANYATVGLYDFAAATAAAPYTVAGGSQIAGFYTPASGTAGAAGNLDVVGNITGWSAQPYLTSLRFNTYLGAGLSVAAYATLSVNDFLVTPNVGPYNVSINNNSLRPAGGSTSYGGPYVVWQNNPAGELIFNSTLGNSKAGTAAYVQAGPGTVAIPVTASGYTGQNYLNGGVTLIAGNGSLGAAATGAAVNLNGGTLLGNASFALDNNGASLRPINLLANGGGLAATAGNTLTVDGLVGGAAGSGPLTIGIPALTANNNNPGLLPGTGSGTANPSAYATGTVVLANANAYPGGTMLQSGTLNINGLNALGGGSYGGLVFNGGTLQYSANLTGSNGSADLTSAGTAGITLAAGGGTIDVNGNSVTYAGSIGNNGPGNLSVKSSLPGGTLTLLGVNNYAGSTTVTNATLVANNASGSATGNGNVTVQNGGTVSGAGALGGSLTVLAGGTLAPGNPGGRLTVGNHLALATGSLTVLQVQPAPPANGGVNVAGTLTEGGTLVVTNPGGPLANGDTFNLFNAGNYAGTFAMLVLPPLPGSLAWDTSRLATAGSLTVTAAAPPVISQLTLAGGQLAISGAGGTPRASCLVLTTTNLASPHWSPLATNPFDPAGNFTFTKALNPDQPQTFFRLQLQ